MRGRPVHSNVWTRLSYTLGIRCRYIGDSGRWVYSRIECIDRLFLRRWPADLVDEDSKRWLWRQQCDRCRFEWDWYKIDSTLTDDYHFLPLASNCRSGDHFNPHTSCRCPASLRSWLFERVSFCRMNRSREPEYIQMIIPSESTDTRGVPRERDRLAIRGNVPDLHVTFVCSYSNILSSITPSNTRHRVRFTLKIAQTRDVTGVGIPEIDRGIETDGENVRRWPIDQIQVEVVLQFGSIEHFEWRLGDFPQLFARRTKKTDRGRGEWRERIGRIMQIIGIATGGIAKDRVRITCT